MARLKEIAIKRKSQEKNKGIKWKQCVCGAAVKTSRDRKALDVRLVMAPLGAPLGALCVRVALPGHYHIGRAFYCLSHFTGLMSLARLEDFSKK